VQIVREAYEKRVKLANSKWPTLAEWNHGKINVEFNLFVENQ
jgi:hypothetical protein